MNLIAAVDRNWAIGKGRDLLVDIPEDKKFFREETLGKVVVMGRKTFESLPAGALDFRTNIVLTKDRKFAPKDVCVCHCVDEVLEMVSVYDTKDVYIIGGQSVYEQFAGLCDTAHITKVDYAYDADKYFPDNLPYNFVLPPAGTPHPSAYVPRIRLTPAPRRFRQS